MNVLAGCRQKNAVSAKAIIGVLTIVLLLVSPLRGAANASHHYTDKQMDALAVRVGQTFWLYSPDGKLPAFVNAPNAAAAAFRPGDKESFVITDLAGRAKKDPSRRRPVWRPWRMWRRDAMGTCICRPGMAAP